MRIGLVTDFYYPWMAGPAVLLRNLGHGLAARGHSVALLAPSPDGPGRAEMDGPVAVTRVATIPSPTGFGLRVAPWPGPAVHRWLDTFNPDVVHVHHPFPISAVTIFAARRRGIPVAATNHTIPECSLWGIRDTAIYRPVSAAFGRWVTLLLNRCDEVTTPTATAARELQKLGFKRHITPISNGVDGVRFAPGDADYTLRDRLGLDHRPIVLYTGRLDAEKDMGTWLRAAAACRARPQVQFVIGGNGTDRARLEQLSAQLEMASEVRFIGYLSDEDYPALYRLADVYFITSPVELQSITTLEAISSGLPVVAVSAGALPELVNDGENGLCPAPGDIDALAASLDLLLSEPALREAMGAHSRVVAKTHSLDHSVAVYEQFLNIAAGTSRGDVRRERSAAVGS